MYDIFGSTDGDTDTDIIDVDTDTDIINKLFFDHFRNIYTQMSYVKFRVSQKWHSRTTYNSLIQCSYLIFTYIQHNFPKIACELMFGRCFQTLFPPLL